MCESRTIWWDGGLMLIDQTRLPGELLSLRIKSVRQLVEAIQSLRVRGAPALGAAGAYGIALAADLSPAESALEVMAELEIAADMIRGARPTAVNLSWGVDRALAVAASASAGAADDVRQAALAEAEAIAEEDIAVNKALGRIGAKLLDDGDTVLTHCNAGRLACVGWGTALGVVRSAVASGKSIAVIACETRPLHQGSRLTAWELSEDGIPVTLICDSMSGILMRKGKIDKVIVGADRITRDAVFNKIGTYSHAVLARHHRIPFYVAAPLSTFDRWHEEAEILVEERSPEEITTLGGCRLAPQGIDVYNPAFDATPLELVSGLITEKGVFRPPLMPPL
ncbi:MAG TPA: S-methyl-5-thioribose-1-phosphate isomerase [Methanothrix sp.]|jgi:methylthioribose-1-phosphate isomerase|nr:S-methyl-5-thioribose-1-phosphate isomerase [Methanothrix sp.]HOV81251.1 S-methyl-5-thioribose-1-phosphate isomerase [Methanothrix sp.]HPC88824.1 S-methyl-5-thioribose-1-phosphate isomerase [Methanothrix sp.]HQE87288.1 S-methyl-5-thioribose-1-phosphate isomerase [Methanothrix sp.]HQI67802.1 S-methyl-5-thioribose-1-phosphate isomerase [Methanothrix sp.]